MGSLLGSGCRRQLERDAPWRGPGADQVHGLGDSRPWLTRRSEPWQPYSPAASRPQSLISDPIPRRLCATWRLPVLAWIWLPRFVPPSAPGAVRPGAPRRPGALIFPSQVPSLCRPRPAIHSTAHPQNIPRRIRQAGADAKAVVIVGCPRELQRIEGKLTAGSQDPVVARGPAKVPLHLGNRSSPSGTKGQDFQAERCENETRCCFKEKRMRQQFLSKCEWSISFSHALKLFALT